MRKLLTPIWILLVAAASSLSSGCFRSASPVDRESQKIAAAEMIVELKLETISNLVDPKDAPYDDCNIGCKATIKKVIAGNPGLNVNGQINVIFPLFENRKPSIPSAWLQKNQLLVVNLVPEDLIAESGLQTQVSGDATDFGDCYYVTKVYQANGETCWTMRPKYILAKAQTSGIIASKEGFAPDIREKASRLRAQAIAADIKKVDDLLERNGGWNAWDAKASKIKAAYHPQEEYSGNEIFFHKVPELYQQKFLEKSSADQPIAGYLALKRFLSERDIDLILVSVPHKLEFLCKKQQNICDDMPLDVNRYRMIKTLLMHDIEIIDGLPEVAAVQDKPFDFREIDLHLANGNIAIGKLIADRLSRYPFRKDFAIDAQIVKDKNGCAVVKTGDGTLFDTNAAMLKYDSPVLVAGDSFSGYQYKYGSATSFLAFFSGVSPQLVQAYSGGGSILQTLRYLEPRGICKRKYVCVVIISPWDFTMGLNAQD